MAKQPKKLGGAASNQDASQELVEKYVQLLRDYQNVLFAVVVLVLAAGILLVWHHQRSQQQEDQAWAELGKAHDKSMDVDKLKPLLDKYAGTDAHPFLVLALTSKLYERGEKPDLEQARTLLEQTQYEVVGNKTLHDVVQDELDGIKKELGDQKLWGAGTAHVGSGSK